MVVAEAVAAGGVGPLVRLMQRGDAALLYPGGLREAFKSTKPTPNRSRGKSLASMPNGHSSSMLFESSSIDKVCHWCSAIALAYRRLPRSWTTQAV